MVKTVWAVSLPILFLQISETLLYVTDTAFLARVGTTELAALALADTLLQFWTVPVAGLIEAMVILIARRAASIAGATSRNKFAVRRRLSSG